MSRVISTLSLYLSDWLDLHRPNTRDTTWVIGGFIVTVVGLVVLDLSFEAVQLWLGTPAEPASHATTTELKRAKAEGGVSQERLLRTLAGLWVAAIVEEFAIRNHVQKLIAIFAGWPVAIGVASVFFALLHIPAYGGLPVTLGLTESLSAIFVGSVVLGTVYWRTGNVLASMLLHGLWNTFVLAVVVLAA